MLRFLQWLTPRVSRERDPREYKVVAAYRTHESCSAFQKRLNQLGKEGWSVSAITQHVVILERPT